MVAGLGRREPQRPSAVDDDGDWDQRLALAGPGALTDGECLRGVAAGEQRCFVEVLSRYQDRVVNLLYRFVGDWSLGLDLAQETFLRVHTKASTFRPDGNASAWIVSIAMNLARDHLRGRKRRILYLESDLSRTHASASATGPGPHDRLENAERDAIVHEALRELPDSARALLLLRDFEGVGYRELAQLYSCEIGTVKSRLHRARKSFEQIYSRKMS